MKAVFSSQNKIAGESYPDMQERKQSSGDVQRLRTLVNLLNMRIELLENELNRLRELSEKKES